MFAPLKADWSLDRDALARAFGPRTRALILCNPSNPTAECTTTRTSALPPHYASSTTSL